MLLMFISVLSFFNKEISLNFDPFMFLALPLPDEIVTPSSAYVRIDYFGTSMSNVLIFVVHIRAYLIKDFSLLFSFPVCNT